MQADDYRSNATVTGVNTNIQNAGVRLAELVDRVFIEDANYFIQANI